MASPTTDRRLGLVGNTAIKAPVRVIATSNITLSGLQTIDGVALSADDRVLCAGQTDGAENLIYNASTSAWTLAKDSNGNYDLVKGTTVQVTDGTTYAGSYWRISTSGSITVGTTSITWERALVSSATALNFLQAGTGAVTRTAQDKMRDIVSVKDFGAVGDGVTDDTTAIQAAIDYIKSKTYGGTVYFPGADYKVSSLNVGNPNVNDFKPTLTLRGDGVRATRILGSTNGLIVVDALGRNFLCLENMTIGTAAGVIAQAGLLLARNTTGSQNCNNGRFVNLNVEGAFSIASVCSIASESNRWYGCRFENTNSALPTRCFYTSTNNDVSIVTTLGTILTSSNTDNKMFGCEFYNTQNGCNPVVFSESASYYMAGCSIITGTRTGAVRLVTYKATSGGVFTGPVTWDGCHLEAGGSTIVFHYFQCDGILTFFYDIGIFSGTVVNSSSAKLFTDYDRDGAGRAYLGNFNVIPPRATGNLEMHLDGIRYSNVDFTLTQFTGKLILAQNALQSVFRANTLYDPLVATSCHSESYSSAAPTSGTYSVKHIAHNTAPAAGAPWAWVCSTLGTAGTLNGGATTGSINNGSLSLTVNTTTGLEEGQVIAIAGVGGAKKVLKISGTTVTLHSASGATVAGAAVSFSNPVFAATANLV